MLANPRSRHELHFSLHPDFALDAIATSLVGSRAKLQDVPKIEQLLVGRLRSFVHDRFVWPKFWTLTLPNLVPKNQADRQEQHETSSNGNIHITGPEDFRDEETVLAEDAFEEQEDFFEGEPVSFSKAGQPYPNGMRKSESSSSLPGSLPTIEAWRTQSAATGGNIRSRSRPTQSARSNLAPSSQGEARYRHNGMSVA